MRKLTSISYFNVAAAFLIWWFLVVGASIVMPTLYRSVMLDTGWSLGDVALHSSIKLTAGALVALFGGFIIEAITLRGHFIFAISSSLFGFVLLSFNQSMIAYYVSAGLIGIGIVCGSVGAKVLISRWFSYRFGFVVGLAMLGAAGAGLTVPVGAQLAAEAYGWRIAAGAYGCILALVLFPIVFFVVRMDPEFFGTSAEELDPGKDPELAKRVQSALHPAFDKSVMTGKFWFAVLLIALAGGVDFGLTEHTPLFVSEDRGLGDLAGAAGIGGLMVFGGFGKIGFGWLCDRYSLKAVAACWMLLGIGILLAFGVYGGATLLLFTAIRGIAHGGAQLDYAIIAKHVFGNRDLAKTLGVFTAAHAFGGAAVAGLVGYGRQWTGSYEIPFLILAVVAFLAALAILQFKSPFWIGASKSREADAASAV